MPPSLPQGLKRPVFFRLTLVFVLTSLCLVSLVAAFVLAYAPHNRPMREVMRNNWSYHILNLAQRIGDPPDIKQAQAISAELGLEISLEGPGLKWSSSPGIPDLASVDTGGRETAYGVVSGHSGRSFYWLIHHGKNEILFWSPGSPYSDVTTGRFLVLLALILFILFLSYLTVSLLFNPLKLLLDGVEHVKAGDLDHKIEVRGRTEFKSLADSFNQMTLKVRDMLRARERLLSDVSHELRSPLTRVKVALEMIPKSPKRESIRTAISEMESMMTEILETQKLRSDHGGLKKSRLDLAILARNVADNFKASKPGLKVSGAGQGLEVQADPERLAIAVRNVLENAVKYSAGQPRPVEVRLEARGGEAFLSVRDHGIGIPQEDLELVFEPFYRVDKSRARKTGGYGLGLGLCREIIRAHGGEISLSLPDGGGTMVEIKLKKA